MADTNRQRGYDICGGETRGGGSCTRPAGWGTPHQGVGRCKLHAGSTPTHVQNAQEIQAQQAAAKFGIPVKTTGRQALSEELARTNGMIAYYLGRLHELDDGELIWGTEKRVVKTAPGQQGAQGQPTIEVHQSGRPHVYLQLLERERRHFATVAADMVRIGIEERQLRIDQQLGVMIAAVIQKYMGDLDNHLCAACQRVQQAEGPQIAARRLRELSAA